MAVLVDILLFGRLSGWSSDTMLTATSKPGEFSGTLPECNRVPSDALLEEASLVALLVTVELNVGVSVEP